MKCKIRHCSLQQSIGWAVSAQSGSAPYSEGLKPKPKWIWLLISKSERLKEHKWRNAPSVHYIRQLARRGYFVRSVLSIFASKLKSRNCFLLLEKIWTVTNIFMINTVLLLYGHGMGGHLLFLQKCHTHQVIQNGRLMKETANAYNLTLQELSTY